MKLRTCTVTKDFKTLSGHYARAGAKGVITANDGGYAYVLFEDESLHLINSNALRGNMLEVPFLNLSIGEHKEIEV